MIGPGLVFQVLALVLVLFCPSGCGCLSFDRIVVFFRSGSNCESSVCTWKTRRWQAWLYLLPLNAFAWHSSCDGDTRSETQRGRFRTAHAQRGHSAGTMPIITLFIPGTPLKTTHLQKHA